MMAYSTAKVKKREQREAVVSKTVKKLEFLPKFIHKMIPQDILEDFEISAKGKEIDPFIQLTCKWMIFCFVMFSMLICIHIHGITSQISFTYLYQKC
jgi:hypothetical protein